MAAITETNLRGQLDIEIIPFKIISIDSIIILELVLMQPQQCFIFIDSNSIRSPEMFLNGSVSFSFRANGAWKFITPQKTEKGNFEDAYFDVFTHIEDFEKDFMESSPFLNKIINKSVKYQQVLKYIQLRLFAIQKLIENK